MAEPDRDDADVIGRLLMRVYEIHERVIARGGSGLEGIRDAALLHAAVARPFATFGEAELYPTDFDKAAALFHALIKSHPFLDGTKRTAFAAAVYFLYERGYTLHPMFKGSECPCRFFGLRALPTTKSRGPRRHRPAGAEIEPQRAARPRAHRSTIGLGLLVQTRPIPRPPLGWL